MERLESATPEVIREKKKEIGVAGNAIKANAAVTCNNISVTVGDGVELFKVKSFVIEPGERVAIMGRNGSGKSTLIKSIVAAFARGGTEQIRFNPRLTLGYYDQELRGLSETDRIGGFIAASAALPGDRICKELVHAGFPYRRHDDKIGNLSGGEKARLQFLALKLQKPSLLLLDEPTNHIDMEGVEDLEEELETYEGTCIFVSHDRRFVRGVATRFFLIDEGFLEEIPDPQIYYELLKETQPLPDPAPKKAMEPRARVEVPMTQSEIVSRIEELEQKAGRMHRGPKKDAVTREIEDLYSKLE